jgi:hypothetical protein
MKISSVGISWVIALVVLVSACAGSGTGANSSPRGDSNVITREQLDRLGGQNLYDVIQSARPGWFRTRGTQSFRENATGSGGGRGAEASVQVVPGTGTVVVYMDNTRIGDIISLRQITPQNVESIHFIDAATATNRWGSGHMHGAIQVIPRTR